MNKSVIGTSRGTIDICNLDPDDIFIDDIFQTLGNSCRFAGRCNRFYSVAQHSIFMMSLASRFDFNIQLGALCHDFAEAFIGDIITPIKRQIKDIKIVENEILEKIGAKYRIGCVNSSLIGLFDEIAVYNEAKELGFHQPEKWVSALAVEHVLDYESKMILEAYMPPDIAGQALKIKYEKMVK